VKIKKNTNGYLFLHAFVGICALVGGACAQVYRTTPTRTNKTQGTQSLSVSLNKKISSQRQFFYLRFPWIKKEGVIKDTLSFSNLTYQKF
jgi:hypothetical protein